MTGTTVMQGQRVRVLDADGTPLTAAVSGVQTETEAVTLAEIEQPSVLMTFYFGRGERQVVLEYRERTVAGTLETWWVGGGRIWQIYVESPLTTLGPVGSAHPELAARR